MTHDAALQLPNLLTRFAEQVAAQRFLAIRSMFTLLERAIKELISPSYRFRGTSTGMTRCRNADKQDAPRCHAFQLGSLIQALAARSFYPVPSPSHYAKTVHTCRSELSKVVAGMETMGTMDGHSHISCAPGISLAAKISNMEANFALTSAQRKHLEQQASKSGVSSVGPKASSMSKSASCESSTSAHMQWDIPAFGTASSPSTSARRGSTLVFGTPVPPEWQPPVTFRAPMQPVASTSSSSPPAPLSVLHSSSEAPSRPATNAMGWSMDWSSSDGKSVWPNFGSGPSKPAQRLDGVLADLPPQPAPNTLDSSTAAQPESSIFGPSNTAPSSSGDGTTPPGSPCPDSPRLIGVLH